MDSRLTVSWCNFHCCVCPVVKRNLIVKLNTPTPTPTPTHIYRNTPTHTHIHTHTHTHTHTHAHISLGRKPLNLLGCPFVGKHFISKYT